MAVRRGGARRRTGPWLPPRWFIVRFWHAHRRVVAASDGRRGLWRPKPNGWGALQLTTTGRQTGQPRQVLVGYLEDGDDLVTMAMNGWGTADPAWWLNLQSDPRAIARTKDGTRRVRARRAEGAEHDRLWARWCDVDKDLDAYAARRPRPTAVVVLEPAGVDPSDDDLGADAATSDTGGSGST